MGGKRGESRYDMLPKIEKTIVYRLKRNGGSMQQGQNQKNILERVKNIIVFLDGAKYKNQPYLF